MSELICLQNAIGLSRNPCPCFDDDKPIDADVSKSGLYLDELQGLDLKIIGADVECGDETGVWGKMQKAIDIAINTFRTDVLASINAFAESRRKTFIGLIGTEKSKASRVTGAMYNGLVIQGCNIKGGEFTLKGITTLMDTTATFDVYVYNNISDNPLLLIPNVNSVANTITQNPLVASPNNTFPLYTTECDNLEYYIVYAPTGFNPRDNKVSCGCSRKEEWQHWFDVQGTVGDDLLNRETFVRNDFANGLILDLCINCNTSDLICGGENEDLDYMNDANARVIATSLQLKAAEVLINDILSSGEINRYTMMHREALYGKRAHFAKEYGMRIEWLGEHIEIGTNDCLGCVDDRIKNVAILT